MTLDRDLILVVGDRRSSKLLKEALLISEIKKDRNGRPYQAVSNPMSRKLGINGALQRSLPSRWIKGEMHLNNSRAMLE